MEHGHYARRLFTNLRADANGRPFRTGTVDRIFDPASIVTGEIDVFNPDDEAVYVFPGPGLVNNGGIATLWHDHYAQEYTVKSKFTYKTEDKVHYISLGFEHKEQTYQWIDVDRPWVGAPIQINDTLSTPSTSIGRSNDVWKASPATGGIFVQDEIRYQGIIATLGVRFNYWAPGKFVDDAVENPRSTGTRCRTRCLPPADAAGFWPALEGAPAAPDSTFPFPVTANNVLYFNYPAMRLPHPRFVYAGLDPSFRTAPLSDLGNPNLNPDDGFLRNRAEVADQQRPGAECDGFL
ncbi:MAG: hypothetical protein R3B47_16645 [Bacteroidia bacterium]